MTIEGLLRLIDGVKNERISLLFLCQGSKPERLQLTRDSSDGKCATMLFSQLEPAITARLAYLDERLLKLRKILEEVRQIVSNHDGKWYITGEAIPNELLKQCPPLQHPQFPPPSPPLPNRKWNYVEFVQYPLKDGMYEVLYKSGVMENR